jgi:uncharacterized membrane protein YjjP (DUF1212 family)
MLLRIRPIAVSVAVLGFFAIGIIGSFGGLPPYTCCKRAVLGAAVAYLAAGAAVKAVNAILTQAVIANEVKKLGHAGDNES